MGLPEEADAPSVSVIHRPIPISFSPVFLAVLQGHQPDRGVFRTTDEVQHWDRRYPLRHRRRHRPVADRSTSIRAPVLAHHSPGVSPASGDAYLGRIQRRSGQRSLCFPRRRTKWTRIEEHGLPHAPPERSISRLLRPIPLHRLRPDSNQRDGDHSGDPTILGEHWKAINYQRA